MKFEVILKLKVKSEIHPTPPIDAESPLTQQSDFSHSRQIPHIQVSPN